MERRREQRHPVDQEVRLWILGETEISLPARLEELSGIGARIRTQRPVPLGAAVRVEWDESMYLGECVHCAPFDQGSCIAGLHFEQVLENGSDLRRMMESLMAESADDQADPAAKRESSRRFQTRD